ncbi:hypothetical protein GUJ93_ZPchr0004g38569 [Zizania palustris]|uniref:Uncharacterized protein n=1 Tax=Zizania palustris TaxID=103762 RepID=A0A8J5S1A0_ZIZPA|nr:hypothetical protein GUJ93_ZPchr0004g38569 [Zizania palustris]
MMLQRASTVMEGGRGQGCPEEDDGVDDMENGGRMGLWWHPKDVGAPVVVAWLARALRGPWVVAELGTHGCGLWGSATVQLEGSRRPIVLHAARRSHRPAICLGSYSYRRRHPLIPH